MDDLIVKEVNSKDGIKENSYWNKFPIKFNKKIMVILAVIITIGLGFGIVKIVLANQGLKEDQYTILKAGSNINKINVKGEVKSENLTDVYSNVTLPIKEVKVDIGDKVKVNDVLAILDKSKLEDQINELEATISTTEASNKTEFDNAKLTYETLLSESSEENNGEIKSVETALNAAKLDYENKKRIYENNKSLFERDGVTLQEFKEIEISYENAKNTFDKCTVDLENVKKKIQMDLNTAKSKYDLARIKCEDNSQHVLLENMKRDLNNAVITSPVDGIISVKNAIVGNTSTGKLFEIKDDNNVTVTVDVKEVDIEKVKVGQKAEVKTDSTGTDIINGEIISVNPLAKAEENSALELNNDSNDKESEFEVKIKIIDPAYKLKIGMKAQVDIILDKKDGVYTVPAQCIVKDKDDNDCLYIADKEEEKYVVKQIPITKGTETDLNVEVLGQDLKDGMIVLNSPSDYEISSEIKIKGK